MAEEGEHEAYRLKQSLSGHGRSVSSVKFSPDGALLASASADKTIRLYSTADLALVAELRGHEEGISDVSFSPDSRFLCSASDDRSVRLWDLPSASLLKTLALEGIGPGGSVKVVRVLALEGIDTPEVVRVLALAEGRSGRGGIAQRGGGRSSGGEVRERRPDIGEVGRRGGRAEGGWAEGRSGRGRLGGGKVGQREVGWRGSWRKLGSVREKGHFL